MRITEHYLLIAKPGVAGREWLCHAKASATEHRIVERIFGSFPPLPLLHPLLTNPSTTVPPTSYLPVVLSLTFFRIISRFCFPSFSHFHRFRTLVLFHCSSCFIIRVVPFQLRHILSSFIPLGYGHLSLFRPSAFVPRSHCFSPVPSPAPCPVSPLAPIPSTSPDWSAHGPPFRSSVRRCCSSLFPLLFLLAPYHATMAKLARFIHCLSRVATVSRIVALPHARQHAVVGEWMNALSAPAADIKRADRFLYPSVLSPRSAAHPSPPSPSSVPQRTRAPRAQPAP